MRFCLPCCLLIFTAFATASAEDYELKPVKELPKSVPAELSKVTSAEGFELTSEDGPQARYWFRKEVPIKENFKPGFTVKYPFMVGEFLGILEVLEGAELTDFRGQELQPGVYTLRYGQQPEDGNHIGTSETADFLLSLPVKIDAKPETITSKDDLNQQSAKSVGSTHPAIFSLSPAEKEFKETTLQEDDRGFWILQVPVSGKAGETSKSVPMRLVVVGVSEG